MMLDPRLSPIIVNFGGSAGQELRWGMLLMVGLRYRLVWACMPFAPSHLSNPHFS